MMKFKSVFGSVLVGLLLVTSSALVACSPESPKLTPLPPPKEKVKNDMQVKFEAAVDILFVVDDSGSMSGHQANLASNIDLFTSELKKSQFLDYHIGVITSSYYGNGSAIRGQDGALVAKDYRNYFVDRNTINGDKILKDNLIVGTSGSSTEKFFDPVQAALTPPMRDTLNDGFYRQDAHLVVIFITDTEDQSTKLGAADYYQFLLGLKNGNERKVISYGVFIPPGVTGCSQDDSLNGRFEKYFLISKAVTFSLCDPMYGSKLASLGVDLVGKVEKIMYLSRPADPETIVVKADDMVIPNDPNTGWSYDPARNAIRFGDDVDFASLPKGSQITVDFIALPYED